jgi:pimeloyl-ACP methyl ester carboxylesterase
MKDITLTGSFGHLALWDTEAAGDSVVLIHGNSLCKEVFRRQFESDLGRALRLVAIDLPGHGASSNAADPKRAYTISGYASAVTEVIGELGLERPVLFGWSLGGHIALDLMPKYADLAGVMICGTPPVPASPEGLAMGFAPTELMALTGARDWSEQDAEAYARTACGEPFEPFMLAAARRADGVAREVFFADALSGGPADQRRIVETAATPLAIVNGARDGFINADYFESVRYANLWEGKVHRLEGLGHAPFWEAPERFNPLLARFVADVKAPA